MPRPGTNAEMRRLIKFLRAAYNNAATESRKRKTATDDPEADAHRKAAYDHLCALERLGHLVAADAVEMRRTLQKETDSQL